MHSSNSTSMPTNLVSEEKNETSQERTEKKAFFEDLRNNRNEEIKAPKTTDHSKYFPKNNSSETS